MNGKVTAQRLNVRSSAGLDGAKLGVLVEGALVRILDRRGNWLEIKFNGRSGFVHGDFVETFDEVRLVKGQIIAHSLNVRSRPSLNGEILGTLKQSSVIDVLDESGDWLEVEFNGQKAFLHRDYVNLMEVGEEKRGKVIARTLNVRLQPTRSGVKLGSLSRTAIVDIVAKIGKWYEIKFNGLPAYVHSDYVRIDSEENVVLTPFRYLYQNPKLHKACLVPNKRLSIADSDEEQKVAKTWNRFGGLVQELSDSVGIKTGSVIAVLCVESGGIGFGKNKKITIRFENHQFWNFWGKYNPKCFSRHFRYNSGKRWQGHKFRIDPGGAWRKFHESQTNEWEVLEFARDLSDTAALKSISMGASQVMGFNHARIGYSTVQKMFEYFGRDIRFHIFGLFDFFDSRMIAALKRPDFVEFARFYNGAGQAEKYGECIRKYYEVFEHVA